MISHLAKCEIIVSSHTLSAGERQPGRQPDSCCRTQWASPPSNDLWVKDRACLSAQWNARSSTEIALAVTNHGSTETSSVGLSSTMAAS